MNTSQAHDDLSPNAQLLSALNTHMEKEGLRPTLIAHALILGLKELEESPALISKCMEFYPEGEAEISAQMTEATEREQDLLEQLEEMETALFAAEDQIHDQEDEIVNLERMLAEA